MRKGRVVGRIYGMKTVERAIKTEIDTRTEYLKKRSPYHLKVSPRGTPKTAEL